MNTQSAICINVQVDAPYLSIEEYAKRTGIPIGTVRSSIRAGEVPIKPKKKEKERIYINMIALAKQAITEDLNT